jgi:hypothetical protein
MFIKHGYYFLSTQIAMKESSIAVFVLIVLVVNRVVVHIVDVVSAAVAVFNGHHVGGDGMEIGVVV